MTPDITLKIADTLDDAAADDDGDDDDGDEDDDDDTCMEKVEASLMSY